MTRTCTVRDLHLATKIDMIQASKSIHCTAAFKKEKRCVGCSVFHVTDKDCISLRPAEKITGEAVCTCRQRSATLTLALRQNHLYTVSGIPVYSFQ